MVRTSNNMTPYTPTEIHTILYQIDDIDGLKVLVDYLQEHSRLYQNYMEEWLEDIRLLIIILQS